MYCLLELTLSIHFIRFLYKTVTTKVKYVNIKEVKEGDRNSNLVEEFTCEDEDFCVDVLLVIRVD